MKRFIKLRPIKLKIVIAKKSEPLNNPAGLQSFVSQPSCEGENF